MLVRAYVMLNQNGGNPIADLPAPPLLAVGLCFLYSTLPYIVITEYSTNSRILEFIIIQRIFYQHRQEDN